MFTALNNYFEPVHLDKLSIKSSGNTVLNHINVHQVDSFPEWEKADIALFYVPEYRGVNIEKKSVDISALRSTFYTLKSFTFQCDIVDLGNLKTAASLAMTYEFVTEVCEILLEQNIIPIVLGGSHDLSLSIFKAYQKIQQQVAITAIDATLDFNLEGFWGERHLYDLLSIYKEQVITYNHLAYQRYITDNEHLIDLRRKHFEVISIGDLRNDFKQTEPFIREADFISFDLNAIRKSEAKNIIGNNVFGLTAEEACQICWYAGFSNKMSAVGLFGYLPQDTTCEDTNMLISVMLWYLAEGISRRTEEYSFHSSHYTKYTVPIIDYPYNLNFYKDKLSEKWWMEVTLEEQVVGLKPIQHPVIPCSYQDYREALSGNLPNRWVKAYGRWKEA